MNIILEGPKASGKTTLAELIMKEGFGRVHLDATTKNDFEFHNKLLIDNDKTVFDRFSIGEIIYSQIYNREPKMTLSQMEESLLKENTKCVILYSSDFMLLVNRISNRDKDKNIDYDALEKSNKLFEFFAFHLSRHENIVSFDVSKYDAKRIMEELNIEEK